MKKIFFMMLLLLIPVAMASNEYGKITSGGGLLITDFDVIVDGKTSRNLEYGDEITKIANPDSEVEFKVEVLNNWSVDAEDVEIVVEIEDLDLDDSTSESEIRSTDDKTMTISLKIPSDADEDDYKVYLEVSGEINNTIHRVEYLLDLVVEEIEVDEEEQDYVVSSLLSMSNNISELNEEIGNYFGPYAQCTSDRDTCQKEKEGMQTQIDTLNDYKSRFDTCNSNLLAKQAEIADYQTALEVSKINSTRLLNEKIKTEDSRMLWAIVPILVMGGFYVWQNKNKISKSDVEKTADKEPDEDIG